MKLEETIKLRLSAELKQALEAVSKSEGRSLADVIRRALTSQIEELKNEK